MNVLSLFDGISAGQLALKRAGINVTNYFSSEIDKYAIQTTQYNFPNTIQLGNVETLELSGLPKIDLLLAGSPCQGFSTSGNQPATHRKFQNDLVRQTYRSCAPEIYFRPAFRLHARHAQQGIAGY